MSVEINSLKHYYNKFNKLSSGVQAMILIIPLGIIFIGFVLMTSKGSTYSKSSGYTKTGLRTVAYKISGNAGIASLTYTNSQGGTSQINDVALPYTVNNGSMSAGDFAYISAQNGRERGDITVQILIDGSVVKESNSSGGYVIASADCTVK